MRDYADQINSLRLCAESDDPVDECCWEDCNQHHGSRDSICRQKIMMDAADAIEELVAAVPKWHPVSEKPERKDPYYARDNFIVRLQSGCIKELTYEFDNSDRCGDGYSPLFKEGWRETASPVTHWMHMPKFDPPKEVLPNGDV